MRKRTLNALMSALKHVDRAREILSAERVKLEESDGYSGLTDDMGWTENHLDQATTEGLDHHLEERKK